MIQQVIVHLALPSRSAAPSGMGTAAIDLRR